MWARVGGKESWSGARLCRFDSLSGNWFGLGLGLLVALGAGLLFVGTASALDTVQRIAFATDRDGNNEIYVMDPSGNYLSNRTNNPGLDSNGKWSRDGNKLAFGRGGIGGSSDGEVFVMNADGSNQINLTNNTVFDGYPAWSPDGSQLALLNRAGLAFELSRMNAVDGSSKTSLTTVNFLGSVTWSANGSQIAYGVRRTEPDNLTSQRIFAVNAVDGSNPAPLTANHPANDSLPAWSPDGQKIAFRSDRNGNGEIYLMNADGSDQKRLTENPADDSYPAWSPDGQKIAFSSSRDGNFEIYIMNADGSDQRRLTNNPATDTAPDWGVIPNTCANVAPAPCGTDLAVSQPSVEATAEVGTSQPVVVPLEIRNDGPTDAPDTTLNWSVNEGSGDCSTPSDAPWMSESESLDAGETGGETSTSETDTENITLDPSALAPGTYNSALCITSDDPDEPVTSVPVTLSVTEPVVQPPPITVQPPPVTVQPPPAMAGPSPVIAAADTTPPTLTLLAASRARAGQKVNFSYRLTEAGRVTFTVKSKGSTKALGRFSVNGKLGSNRTSFSGKLGRKKLRPGKYVAQIVAVDASGNRSRAYTVGFQIRR